MPRAFGFVACAAALPMALVGCKGVLGIDEGVPIDAVDSAVGVDTGLADSGAAADTYPLDSTLETDADADLDSTTDGVTDSGADATGDTTLDASPDVEAETASDTGPDAGPVTYGKLSDSSRWSTFDVATIDVAAQGFGVVAFDGRYLDFGAAGPGILARYDTHASFAAPSAWSVTNIKAKISTEFFGFNSEAFDGRYLYFAQAHYGTARFDTLGDPAVGSSWTFGVGVPAAGMVFDGQYLYEIPNYSGIFLGTVDRYDTKSSAGFTGSGSHVVYDTTGLGTYVAGFWGAAFDGRYMYLAPGQYGIAARYDTTLDFSSAPSWSTFNVHGIDSTSSNYFGAVYDGRYVYLVPNGRSGRSIVARVDTHADFATAAAWTTFDLQTVDTFAIGFRGGLFDGRYVYFMPAIDSGSRGTQLARFDTTGSFLSASSWETFNVKTLAAGARDFCMGGFDGQYVYLSPCASGIVARFDARNPPALPALPPKLAAGWPSFL